MTLATARRLTNVTTILFLLGIVHLVSAQEACTGEKIFSSPACFGDETSPDEKALFEAVNSYRVANGKPLLKMSPPLNLLGNRRMLDLNQNLKVTTHSWSNCPYSITDKKTWPCLIDAPRRLRTGYTGDGYETLYRTTNNKVNINAALEAWKKSSLHSSIILNEGTFAPMPWDALGVAIEGQFAVLWFGYSTAAKTSSTAPTAGIGVPLDRFLTGFSGSISIDKDFESGSSLWNGSSADKKLRVSLKGNRSEITEAVIDIAAKPDTGRKAIIVSVLANIFPEWTDIDAWLSNSLTQTSENPSAWRTKVVRKILIEVKGDDSGFVRLTVRPQVPQAPKEIY